MTNPLTGSPGNTVVKVPTFEQSSGSKSGQSNGDDIAGDGDFGSLVRQLTSGPKPKSESANGSRTERDNVDAQRDAKTGDASLNGELVTVKDPATRDGELDAARSGDARIDDKPSILKLLAGQGKTRDVKDDGPEPDGEVLTDPLGLSAKPAEQTSNAALPSEPANPDPVTTDATEVELSDAIEVHRPAGEEQVVDAEIEALAERQTNEPEVAVAGDDAEPGPEDSDADNESREAPSLRASVQPDDEADALKPELVASEPTGQASSRPEDDIRARQPAPQPDPIPADPNRQLEPADDLTLAATAAGNARVATSPAQVEPNVPPQPLSQVRVVDGQLRTVMMPAGATNPETDAPAERSRERSAGGGGLPSAETNLTRLLNERRVNDSAQVLAAANSGSRSEGLRSADGSPRVDEDALTLDDRLSTTRLDEALSTRVSSQTGVLGDRPNFEGALNVSRQLSQGVAGSMAVWVSAITQNPTNGGATASSADIMSGRGTPADLPAQFAGPPPGAMRSLRLQLQPATLGTVTAHLTMKNEELHVRFVVEKAETTELIQSQRNVLLAQLVEAGVDVTAANVEVETARPNAARSAGLNSGEFAGFYGHADGGYGSADGQNRAGESERDSVADNGPADDDGGPEDGTTGLANQRPSVVYL